MTEIRLICPGCGSDYELPGSAIPESGREVECAACGHVWLARRADLRPRATGGAAPDGEDGDHDDATDGPVRPAVMPSKRLAPDMLQFLRDEVEHERRLREAEGQTRYRPVSSDDFEADWPATTVTAPAAATSTTPAGTRVIRHRPQPAPQAAPEPGPQPAPVRSAPQRPERVIVRPAAGTEPAAQPHADPAPMLPAATPPRTATRGRYGIGLVAGLALAAAVAGVYVAAPRLPQDGAAAQVLMEWRGGLDRARLWLDDQAARLRG